MAKYKVGDKIRIVNHRTFLMNLYGGMDKWLGKTMTIREVSADGIYFMEEDKHEHYGKGWAWCDSMISGLAEPEFSVSIRFHDRLTVAELIKDGKVVKAKDAWCSPKDKYSMAEGARIAVERLFKKKSDGKPEEVSKPKIGDKFVVIGNKHIPHHRFGIGEIVTLTHIHRSDVRFYENERRRTQCVNDLDVRPYMGNSK